MMFKFAGPSVIQYPSGRWGFVGSVPAKLAFEYESEADLQTATQCGPRLALVDCHI